MKALRLLRSSNPTLFEWSNSPIIYKTTPEWKKVSQIIDKYFLKKSGLYHYLGTAKKNYHQYLEGDMVKLKRYFYVLRPILACKWILEKQTPPPVLFSELMKACLDSKMQPIVNELLKIKTKTPEIGLIPRVDALNEYLSTSIHEMEEEVLSMPNQENANWDELNSLFLDILQI